ncbi:MAG: metal ABC transporter ATP-binding protein [Janthinobacterium lividum]
MTAESQISPRDAAAISLENVTLELGGRVVLRDVNLQIRSGEFVGVLGPNGAGKTTLMRALLGLLKPRHGQISLFGEPVAQGRKLIGYMPQSRSALIDKRIIGRDFVACALGGQRWGMAWPSVAARRTVDAALDKVGARELASRTLAELSGGERQRLLLAQCLLDEPRLLLLDEPLISLDPARQRTVVELVAKVAREQDMTVLFSAHELNPLLGSLDRVLYLGGSRAALGTVDEVITAPVLSRLYDAPIEVMRVGPRIFVMSGDYDMEHHAHSHDHDA